MTIETHGNVARCRCSMNARDLTDILSWKPFYVYIVNMKAEPVNLPRFMIVAYASSASTYTIQARDDELPC